MYLQAMSNLMDLPLKDELSNILGFFFNLAWQSIIPVSQVITFFSLSMSRVAHVRIDVHVELEEGD